MQSPQSHSTPNKKCAQQHFCGKEVVNGAHAYILAYKFRFFCVSLIAGEAHSTDICAGVQLLSGETMLQKINSTGCRRDSNSGPCSQHCYCYKSTKSLHSLDLNLTTYRKLGSNRIAKWQSACQKTKKSAVQVSTTAPCYEGELFTYIQLLPLILASSQRF